MFILVHLSAKAPTLSLHTAIIPLLLPASHMLASPGAGIEFDVVESAEARSQTLIRQGFVASWENQKTAKHTCLFRTNFAD